MIKLKEWEQAQGYAQICADELKQKYNLDVRTRIYTMYDGRKGIYLQLFDKYGHFYKEYASGTHETFTEYKKALKTNYFRILQD